MSKLKQKSLKVYVCGNDLTDIYLGETNLKVYTTQAELKRQKICYKQCGISQIEIKTIKMVRKPMSFDRILRERRKEQK